MVLTVQTQTHTLYFMPHCHIYVLKSFLTPLPIQQTNLFCFYSQNEHLGLKLNFRFTVAFRSRRGNQTFEFFYLLWRTNLSHDGSLDVSDYLHKKDLLRLGPPVYLNKSKSVIHTKLCHKNFALYLNSFSIKA